MSIGEVTGGKTSSELATEAFWFFAHTLISLLVYVGMVTVIYLAHPLVLQGPQGKDEHCRRDPASHAAPPRRSDR